jgi:hypothetical protein
MTMDRRDFPNTLGSTGVGAGLAALSPLVAAAQNSAAVKKHPQSGVYEFWHKQFRTPYQDCQVCLFPIDRPIINSDSSRNTLLGFPREWNVLA